MNYLDKLKKDTKNISDLTIKEIIKNNIKINIITIDTIVNTKNINDFILNDIPNNIDNLYEYLFNNLPSLNIKKTCKYQEIINYLVNGFTIIIIDNNVLAVETINILSRSITESSYEKNITGPKDSFNENFNTSIGLIRKRIKTTNLKLITTNIGKYTHTKVGILYIESIAKEKIIQDTINKLNNISIDGIIDSSYLKKYLSKSQGVFPTIKSSERPDLAAQALLEGKIVIVSDNSPDILILPTFFIDYFHTSDDYYQKNINITFIRIIRLLAFLIAILLPAYYVAITTYNVDFIPINLLVNLISQRESVPSPAFIEAFIMILSFEILRESDTRIPSNIGSSVSILGGLVLGDAAVSAGILSPIMIIVVAISAISALVFQSIDVVNAIRGFRFILIILASLLGLYGIFIGIILIIINLSHKESSDDDYLYPFAPINLSLQKDGFIKINEKILYRNPLLSNNKIRGQEK